MRDGARESCCLEWCRPPVSGRMELPGGEVHVWRGRVSSWSERAARLMAVVSADERKRGERYRLEADRLRFLIGRSLLRHVLGRYLGIGVYAEEFSVGAFGKPSLPAKFGIEFNVSHSWDLILIGVASGRRVGIDVEKMDGEIEVMNLAGEFCSTGEIRELAALSEGERREHFYRLWTGKEAFLKAGGEGFSRVAGDVEFSRLEGWQWRELRVDPGYAAAIVVEGGDAALRGWNGEELMLAQMR